MTYERVSIRPGIKMLSVLKHLNYHPWFALAEFVDNSIQSFFNYQKELIALEGKNFKLIVNIEIDTKNGGRIVVRDNAAGIHEEDFARAFRPAEIPANTTGLSEFGMGMKSAACWFSPLWQVRGSALGEPYEKTVTFDIKQIINDELEEIKVYSTPCNETYHYTEITLNNPHRVPTGRTLRKVKEHLQDIYRVFTRNGLMILRLNGEELNYEDPEVLYVPHYRDTSGPPILWRKNIEFDFGEGLKATGFAAIRKTASTSRAGFSLFRRNRLIQGSGDEGYRPEIIFGKPNSFIYQRVFGEIHLEGFQVSHTKDGFQWDENEEPFLDILKEELSKDELPLLQQAREYRIQRQREDFNKGAEEAVRSTSESIRQFAPPVLDSLSAEAEDSCAESLPDTSSISRRVIDVDLHGERWRVVIELSYDRSIGDWLEIGDHLLGEHTDHLKVPYRIVGLRLSLAHPFMERFSGTDQDQIEPLLRVAAAIGLSEVAARNAGVRQVGTIRRNINELLRNALSKT